MPACKNLDEQKTETTLKSDTIFKERIDTIVIYDPETKIETIKIIKMADTIVHGVSISRYVDTIVNGLRIRR